jgi:hypothetical protein
VAEAVLPIRIRRQYVIGGEVWKTKWTDAKTYSALTDWDTKTISFSRYWIDHHHAESKGTRCRCPLKPGRPSKRRPACRARHLRECLYHELFHVLLDSSKDPYPGHYDWVVPHDNLAYYATRVDYLARTGTDDVCLSQRRKKPSRAS